MMLIVMHETALESADALTVVNERKQFRTLRFNSLKEVLKIYLLIDELRNYITGHRA